MVKGEGASISLEPGKEEKPVGQRITSKENANFKRWYQLLDARGIRKNKQFLLFGEKVIAEVLQEHPKFCLELIYPKSWQYPLQTPKTLLHYYLDNQLFKVLDLLGTQTPILVCKVPTISTWNPEEAPQGMELICPLGDPINVGALLRTAQAFGIKKVILLQEAATPFHPKSTRSASGAILNMELVHGPSIHELNEGRLVGSMVALDVCGADLSTFDWPQNVRLLIGEEGQGLPKNQPLIHSVSIPMVTGMHSLNAMVAASIGLYAYRLQHPFSRA